MRRIETLDGKESVFFKGTSSVLQHGHKLEVCNALNMHELWYTCLQLVTHNSFSTLVKQIGHEGSLDSTSSMLYNFTVEDVF